MKRILIIMAMILIITAASMLTFFTVRREKMYNNAENYISETEELISSRISEIRSTPSDYGTEGKIYYVSNNGSDSNSGLSEHTPLYSVHAANKLAESGDAILFERGGIFRGSFTALEGVTYSAYGSGVKPKLIGNTETGASDKYMWSLVEGTDNIWKYRNLLYDVGNIIYNNGEKTVKKVVPQLKNGALLVEGSEFDPQSSLSENNSFISCYKKVFGDSVDVQSTLATLYVRCDEGNPAEVYNSVEFALRSNLIRGASCATFDNLCLMYAGCHGIGMGTVHDVTVRNCEIGYIGGCAQYYKDGFMTRYGNGVEIYGGCDNYIIENCYIYQCYDAGITHQISSGGNKDCVQKNIYFRNNVIEKCTYNIEYFMGKSENNEAVRIMENVNYTGNILANSGFGWGYDPMRSAQIKAWDHQNRAERFTVSDNIFFLSKYNVYHIGAEAEEWLPKFKNNTYVQYSGSDFIRYGAGGSVQYVCDENAGNLLKDTVKDEDAILYIAKPSSSEA